MYEDLLETALSAGHAAGGVARARLGDHGAIKHKGFRDIATEADVEAQAAAQEVILARFPDAAILGEESDAAAQAEARRAATMWIIDPIDGTTNFSHRFPVFAVALGVCEGDAPVVGVVYDPLHEHTFYAARGAGAFLRVGDGAPERLHVSTVDHMAGVLGGNDWARDPDARQEVIDCLARLAPACRTVRTLGSAALGITYVAAGWMDVYYHLWLSPWDAAAAVVILREAGGRATDLPRRAGDPAREWDLGMQRLLATNGVLHRQALNLLL